MIRLELNNTVATFDNYNPRTEKNGPDRVPACDLNFSIVQSADVLAFFSPTLKSHLFDTEGPKDLADGMRLRYPDMGYPLHHDGEMTGVRFEIDSGIKGPMVFPDSKITKFRYTPMEGGSVIVEFQVQCKPDEKQAGKLYTLQAQNLTVSLIPADLPEMGDGEAPPADKPKGGKKAAPKNADGATVQ